MISVSLPSDPLFASDEYWPANQADPRPYIAIWDNRSVFHTATFDYEGLGERIGNRAVGIGEVPYLDPNSTSRAEALKAAQA